ncbi:pentapeptide repeat-containing protein [Paenibacillus lactis]|uniref:pentapeptide repeat-containing protein n=1 Tax=Paenibacillus lactis TaxID=228574 RepID=UPI000EC44734|nr:hypothetical protein [Paenibacillus lactis]
MPLPSSIKRLWGARLLNSCLRHSRLSQARFRCARLWGSRFRYACLQHSCLMHSRLQHSHHSRPSHWRLRYLQHPQGCLQAYAAPTSPADSRRLHPG